MTKKSFVPGEVLRAADVNEYLTTSRNVLLNSNFNIWQRNTSFTGNTEFYTADRWVAFAVDGSPTRTISRQNFTAGTAPVAGYESEFFYRYAVSAAGSGNTFHGFGQRVEDVRTFANQSVTFSFWAKANAARTITPYLQQNFGTGGSTAVGVALTSVSLTTSWQRFTVSGTLASISGKTIGSNSYLAAYFVLPTATTFTIDFWGMQLEEGSSATQYAPNQPNLQAELSACQRYCYEPHGGYFISPTTFGDVQTAQSTTVTNGTITFPVVMRAKPSMTVAAGSDQFRLGYPGSFIITSVTFNDSSKQQAHLTVVSSGLTTFTGYHFYLPNNRTVPQLVFDAEI